MSKSVDRGVSAPPDRSGGDVAAILKKIQRQLVFLEKKIDGLVNHLQGRSYREDFPADRSYAQKSQVNSLPVTGHSRRPEKKKRRGKSEEKGSDQAFYSKFRKTSVPPGSGSRKKPFHRKKKVRK
jgi:hypothetical protein